MTILTDALYKSAEKFNFNRVGILLDMGLEDERAFLGDHGDLLDEYNPDTPKILAQLERAGKPCANKNQALFELYEFLIHKGHSIPDSSTRNCVARVVAGADPIHHERALALMGTLLEQNMLSWASSQWAKDIIAERPESGRGILSVGPSSNSLFAEAFGYAAGAGNLGMLRLLNENIPKELLENRCAWVDISLPTSKAAAGGHTDCLEYLFDLMPEDQWKKFVPYTLVYHPTIMVAATHKQPQTVQWLLDRGHDINEMSDKREGHILVESIDQRVPTDQVLFLLDKGANPNAIVKGPNALHMAIWRERKELITPLLEHGCSITHRDAGGRTPLILAAQTNEWETVGALIAAGSELNEQDDNGMTALHWACGNDRLEAFLILQEHGARFDISNKENKYPVDIAKGRIKALLEAAHYDANTGPASNTLGRSARL